MLILLQDIHAKRVIFFHVRKVERQSFSPFRQAKVQNTWLLYLEIPQLTLLGISSVRPYLLRSCVRTSKSLLVVMWFQGVFLMSVMHLHFTTIFRLVRSWTLGHLLRELLPQYISPLELQECESKQASSAQRRNSIRSPFWFTREVHKLLLARQEDTHAKMRVFLLLVTPSKQEVVFLL